VRNFVTAGEEISHMRGVGKEPCRSDFGLGLAGWVKISKKIH
jgi:hypothetical protein